VLFWMRRLDAEAAPRSESFQAGLAPTRQEATMSTLEMDNFTALIE